MKKIPCFESIRFSRKEGKRRRIYLANSCFDVFVRKQFAVGKRKGFRLRQARVTKATEAREISIDNMLIKKRAKQKADNRKLSTSNQSVPR